MRLIGRGSRSPPFAVAMTSEITPAELKEIRRSLGLSLAEMATLLGQTGDRAAENIRKMENGSRTIFPAQARLAIAYRDGYRPADWPLI